MHYKVVKLELTIINRFSGNNIFSLAENSMGVNVLMFGFDSVSRMTWMRNLPKTHKYYTQELGGMVLEGYNIVGDGTPQALLPILTGACREG